MSKKSRPEWAPSDYRTNRTARLRAEESRKKYSMVAVESWRSSRLDRQASARSTVSRSSMDRRPSKPALRKSESLRNRDQEVREQLLRDQVIRERALLDQLKRERALRDQLHSFQNSNTVLASRVMISAPAPPAKTVVWRMPPVTGPKEGGSGYLKSDDIRPDSESPIEEFKRFKTSRTSIESSNRSISDVNSLLAETDILEGNQKASRVSSAREPGWSVFEIIRSLKNSLFQNSAEQNSVNNLVSSEVGRNTSPQKSRRDNSSRALNNALQVPIKRSAVRKLPSKSDLVASTSTQRRVSETKEFDLPLVSAQRSDSRDLQKARDVPSVVRPPSSICREQSTSKDYPSSVPSQRSVSTLSTQAQKTVPASSAQVRKTATSTPGQPQRAVSRESNTKKENTSTVRFQKNPAEIIPTRSNLSPARSLKSTSRELSSAKTNGSPARSHKNLARSLPGPRNAPSRTSQRSTSVTTPGIRKESSALRTTRSVSRERSRQSINTQDRYFAPNNLQRTAIKQEGGRRSRTPYRRTSSRKKPYDSLESLEEQIALLEQERRLDVIRRLEETARIKRQELAATRFKIRMSLEEEIENNKKLERILAKIRAIREAGEKRALSAEESQVGGEESDVCQLKGNESDDVEP